ncbi:hypothetical protein B0H21DRAFT_850536 [Amylocystis lapponica]|nr:hypothetical protein B0H21DRAFT_850536 [Amylocystis lapponica]
MDSQAFNDYRWSELIPPHTALTFAAVWDPSEGMITFSGAHLLDSESCNRFAPNSCAANDSPRDALDSQSQVLTIDRFALALAGTTPNTSALVQERENTDAQTDAGESYLPGWIGLPPGVGSPLQSPAFASSVALASYSQQSDHRAMLKACVERAQMAIAGRQIRSAVQPAKHPLYRVQTATVVSERDSVTDEGFCEARPAPAQRLGVAPIHVNLNLKSAFSVTTTSTNNYVEVDFPSTMMSCARPRNAPSCSSWSSLRDVNHALYYTVPCARPRRLRKARSDTPPPGPADPAEVLARTDYNHVRPRGGSSPSPSPTSVCRRNSIARARRALTKLGRCGKHEDEDGWVCVDVTHKVKQRVVQDIVA